MSRIPEGSSATVIAVLNQLVETLGRTSFQVFGGAALDLLDDPDAQVRDLDVALPLNSEVAIAVLARLVELGGEPRSAFRKYWIGLRFPVLMVTVQVGDLLLDLNFLDAVDRIGCFDIDSVRWHFPEGDMSDPLNARRALHDRRVQPVRRLNDENPFLLLGRLLRLSAKYGLPLDDPSHAELVAQLAELASTWTGPNDFHGRQAWEAHLRVLADVVGASADPEAMGQWLATTGIPAADVLGAARVVHSAVGAGASEHPVEFWRAAREEAESGGDRRTDLDLARARSPMQASLPRQLRPAHPLVGVVIPARNEAGYVGRTIESLGRQRQHDGTPFPKDSIAIVVVDQGSCDGTAELVSDCARAFPAMPCEVIAREKLSPVFSRAEGFRHFLDNGPSAPPYLVSADADTFFPPGWLAAMLSCLDDGNDMVVSSGWFEPDLWQRCPNLAARYLSEVGTIFFDSETIEGLGASRQRFLFTEQVFMDLGRPVSDCGFAMTSALYEVLGGFYSESYVDDGREIPAVGWPLEFRADAVGARIGWSRRPGYFTSPRRLLNDPDGLFDSSCYANGMEAFREESRHAWLDRAAGRLDWDALRFYVIKNYVIQRCLTRPARLHANPGYFGAAAGPLAAEIAAFRARGRWWAAGDVFAVARLLAHRYGDEVLAMRHADLQPSQPL